MTTVIRLDGPIPIWPSVTEIDAIMRVVSKQLGKRWLAVRGDGGWTFKPDGEAGKYSYRRRFIAALADATGCDVELIERY
jgi:hypothetical protein